MIRRILVFWIVAGLSLSLGTALSKTLLFDDFDGDELDESKWEIVNWKGNVDVTVENSIVSLKTTGNSRAGLLSRESFNAGAGRPITVHIDGVVADPDAQLDLNFGNWNEWGGEVVELYIEGADRSVEIYIGWTGEEPTIGASAGVTSLAATVEGTNFTFAANGEILDERAIPNASGDFKVHLYSYHAGTNSYDSVTVEDDTPESIEPAGKLAMTWARIKTRGLYSIMGGISCTIR